MRVKRYTAFGFAFARAGVFVRIVIVNSPNCVCVVLSQQNSVLWSLRTRTRLPSGCAWVPPSGANKKRTSRQSHISDDFGIRIPNRAKWNEGVEKILDPEIIACKTKLHIVRVHLGCRKMGSDTIPWQHSCGTARVGIIHTALTAITHMKLHHNWHQTQSPSDSILVFERRRRSHTHTARHTPWITLNTTQSNGDT